MVDKLRGTDFVTNENGSIKGGHNIEFLMNAINELIDENESLKERVRKTEFMIENGLGPEDLEK